MKIINNILKTLVYLRNLSWIFIYIFIVMYSLSISLYGNIEYIIGLCILDILYIYLTYLFYKNTSLNKKNNSKIFKIATINIIIESILYTSMSKSMYSILTIPFFLFYFLPYIILLVSVKFNELYMEKLKN
ncbi:hypothetical protein LZ906_017025 (plasmid) [Paraclostridium ghonii]|uniref:hypothetical protein n=1 Tax=Paraclostridium ghonii TaxID=29358 RepID=UPI00202CBF83|nr:hypothetical protein [Paeniclostridium ghonii]MCM0167861.1 hypothetical protein [Paeniclostridium ghonii]